MWLQGTGVRSGPQRPCKDAEEEEAGEEEAEKVGAVTIALATVSAIPLTIQSSTMSPENTLVKRMVRP